LCWENQIQDSPWVNKKSIRKALTQSVYNASIPNINWTFEEYLDAARAVGLIELREQRLEKKDKLRVAIALTSKWRSFDIPKPPRKAEIPQEAWNQFIELCYRKPAMAHKKNLKILGWIRQHGEKKLAGQSEEVLFSIIDTAIYSGVFVKDTKTGKYTVNIEEKEWPIYQGGCPKVTFKGQDAAKPKLKKRGALTSVDEE
jgi:hypothetical protein